MSRYERQMDSFVYSGFRCAKMLIHANQLRKNSQAMDWDNLNYFLALARGGSLSAASKILGTDHSTVARRIEALEKELKLRLVDRRARAYLRIASMVEIAFNQLAQTARTGTPTA